MDAAATLRPSSEQPPQPKQPVLTLFEVFAGASVAERMECMRAFADEAIEVLNEETTPSIVPAMPDLFIHSHL